MKTINIKRVKLQNIIYNLVDYKSYNKVSGEIYYDTYSTVRFFLI